MLATAGLGNCVGGLRLATHQAQHADLANSGYHGAWGRTWWAGWETTECDASPQAREGRREEAGRRVSLTCRRFSDDSFWTSCSWPMLDMVATVSGDSIKTLELQTGKTQLQQQLLQQCYSLTCELQLSWWELVPQGASVSPSESNIGALSFPIPSCTSQKVERNCKTVGFQHTAFILIVLPHSLFTLELRGQDEVLPEGRLSSRVPRPGHKNLETRIARSDIFITRHHRLDELNTTWLHPGGRLLSDNWIPNHTRELGSLRILFQEVKFVVFFIDTVKLSTGRDKGLSTVSMSRMSQFPEPPSTSHIATTFTSMDHLARETYTQALTHLYS
ncbi:hypothetical protein RRG08_066501 [Elysia crispata]|uniref:Uncharacterized protein n=1 Tax=Elysia crispata TaxID=231223 RepID=A0AAE0YI04_9GAST|nr:hypothetical protein RRG08_066501 [Elysia crispata]